MLSCTQLATDPAGVVALEIALPDSGFVEAGDTLTPVVRALNGAGDSVAAEVVWGALDPAIVSVLDTQSGATLGLAPGTGRIQARLGTLRSNAIALIVQPPLDSVQAEGDVRDTVDTSTLPPDTLSDTLVVGVYATPPPTQARQRRRVTFDIAIFPPMSASVTLLPGDTVFSGASGLAMVQVRLDAGGPPDSVVVAAHAVGHDGTAAPHSPVTFVVEYRP